MNKRIEELAEEAMGTRKHVPPVWQFYDAELEKFAELVVAKEREEIAKMFDGAVWAYDYRQIAAAIRNRKNR